MKKETIRSLTKKGWSQKKIAKQLRIRTSKVVAAQRKLKIGKRVASKFWEHVKVYQEMEEVSRKKAVKAVKKKPYWARKRLARMSKKQREAIKVTGIWEEPRKPKEALKGTFVKIETEEFYVG